MSWFWPWGKSSGKPKRRKNLVVPEYSEKPLSAYVERVSPLEFHGRRLKKKLGRIDYVHEVPEDIAGEIMPEHGGGRFRAKVYTGDKRHYLGIVPFELAGNPLIDGMPIPFPEEEWR